MIFNLPHSRWIAITCLENELNPAQWRESESDALDFETGGLEAKDFEIHEYENAFNSLFLNVPTLSGLGHPGIWGRRPSLLALDLAYEIRGDFWHKRD